MIYSLSRTHGDTFSCPKSSSIKKSTSQRVWIRNSFFASFGLRASSTFGTFAYWTVYPDAIARYIPMNQQYDFHVHGSQWAYIHQSLFISHSVSARENIPSLYPSREKCSRISISNSASLSSCITSFISFALSTQEHIFVVYQKDSPFSWILPSTHLSHHGSTFSHDL